MKNATHKTFSVSMLLIAVVFALAVFSVRPALAINDSNYTESLENCSELEARLRAKTEEFTQKRQDHIDKYSQISGLFSSVNKTLDQAGYDADLLFELQPGLDRRIVEFSEVSQVFLSEMTDATDSACRDKASFKQELEEARESLKMVQTSVADIQEYIQEIVVTSIQSTINGANQ